MKKLKLYLETSVWNFLTAFDAAEKREITISFFDKLANENVEIFISELTVLEIERTKDPARKKELIEVLNRYQPTELRESEEVKLLAQKYVDYLVIPKGYQEDAEHLAYASVYNLDIMVSWNMKHIVKYKTKIGVTAINKIEGYKEIEILTPEEVF